MSKQWLYGFNFNTFQKKYEYWGRGQDFGPDPKGLDGGNAFHTLHIIHEIIFFSEKKTFACFQIKTPIYNQLKSIKTEIPLSTQYDEIYQSQNYV